MKIQTVVAETERNDVPASQKQFQRDALDLAKHLQCPICLDTFSSTVARLRPCMHYFCAECIRECLKHSKSTTDKCPQCKAQFSRRDIEEDGYLSALIEKFMAFDEVKGRVRAAMKDLGRKKYGAPAEGEGRTEDDEALLARQRVENMMLPWVQGVEDAAYESPEESFSELFSKEKGGNVLLDDAVGGLAAPAEGGEAGQVEVAPTQWHVVPPSESEGDEEFVVLKDAAGDAERTRNAKEDRVGGILEGLEAAISQEAKEGVLTGTGMVSNTVVMMRKKSSKRDASEGNLVDPSAAHGEMLEVMVGVNEPQASPEEEKENSKANKDLVEKITAKNRAAVKVVGPNATKARATKTKTKAVVKKKTTMTKKPTAEARTVPPTVSSVETTPISFPAAQRRVPARLQPWTCGACTFENKGAASDCEICGTVKGADAGQVVAEQKSIAKEAKNTEKKGSPVSKRANSRKRRAPVAGNDVVEKSQRGEKVEAFETTPPMTQPTNKKNKLSARERRLLNSSERKVKEKRALEITPVVCTATDATNGSFLSGVIATSSNLSVDDKSILQCSVPKYTSNYSDNVTHVICPSFKDPVITPKYLTALLKGAHIVSMDWLIQCIEQQTHLDEARFSLKPETWKKLGSETGGNGCVAASLLSKYEIQVVIPPLSKKQNPTGMAKASNRVEALLDAAGAKLVNRLPRKIEGSDKRCLVLVVEPSARSADDPSEASQIVMENWYARARGAETPVVRQSWLKESILNGAAMENYDDYAI